MARHGKIARLPLDLRQELNRRLLDGEPGGSLLDWLNALPEVLAVLAADFQGRPIHAQNLTNWRQGGYRAWVTQQEALELAQRQDAATVEFQSEGRPPLADTLATLVAARYAVAARQVVQAEGAEVWQALRQVCADVADLRRGDYRSARLRLEREQFDWLRTQSREPWEKRLGERAPEPGNQATLGGVAMGDEAKRRRLCEILGLPPEPEAQTEAQVECPSAPHAGSSAGFNQGESR